MQKYLFFILVLFLWGSSDSLWAYPIYPRTLSDVYKEADYVVYGKVVGFIDDSPPASKDGVPPPPSMHDGFAVIVIHEELKGEITETQICIADQRSFMCPEPFHFEEGQEVLLFLNKDRKANFYWTFAMSYGGKEVTAEEYSLYKKKLLDLQTILDQSNQEIQEQQYIDWVVNCIKEPLTRWDGVFDLLNEKEENTFERNLVANPYSISREQNRELRQLIFNKAVLDYLDVRLLDYLKEENDVEILDFLYKKVKTTSVENGSYTFFMLGTGLIAELLHRDDLKLLNLEIGNHALSKEGKKKIKDFQKIM